MKIKHSDVLWFLLFVMTVLLSSCNGNQANVPFDSHDIQGQSLEQITDLNAEEMPYKKIWVNSTFTNHMVLQREKPVRIHGYGGNRGDLVTVSFDGKTYEGVVGDDEWEIWLEPMCACKEGKTLTVCHQEHEIIFKDVVVGDVWLCSGQSNMSISVSYILAKDPAVREEYSEYNNWENIRIFERRDILQDEPLRRQNAPERWRVVKTFDEVLRYTAVGVAFGSNLSHMLSDDVPIGILHCSASGSAIEAWVSEEGFKSLNLHYPSSIRHYVDHWLSRCYNGMLYDVMGYTYKGLLWYQGCGNSQQELVSNYRAVFELLRQELKQAAGNREIPIIVMQLVQHNDSVSWASIRQVQWDLMELEGVYTVCGIDLGQKTESVAEAQRLDTVHPSDKWAVGKRMAGAALEKVYGLQPPKDDNPYGLSPAIEKAVLKEDTVYITIADNVPLFPSNGIIGGVEVYDGSKWVEVESEFCDNKIVFCVDKFDEVPKRARYMTSNVIPGGTAYLYNEFGLPLAPDIEIEIEGVP